MQEACLPRLLAQLEVPDSVCARPGGPCQDFRRHLSCNCPQREPTAEEVRARNHQLSIDDWAELLCAAEPEEYTDPPPPSAPALVLSREARVAVYSQRIARGEHWRHPGDLDDGHLPHLSIAIDVRPNGRTRTRGLEIAGRAAA